MDSNALHQFLIDSNKAGYAGGEEKQWIKEPDGSTTIPYTKDDWKSHDNFFGGEPYGGRLVVSFQDKPVWMMVYYGWVAEGADPNPVYKILRSALMNMPAEAPFRGPRELTEDGFAYTNTWEGTVDRYSGTEQITQNGTLIYQADYRGGLVDQRFGD